MSANMFSQRALQIASRRLAATNPSKFAKPFRLSAPAAIALGQRVQYRPATTEQLSQAQGYDILANQRLHRPVSPHLTIYRPQIPWILSSLNRITGVVLSGTFYLFGIAYLVAPAFGWHLESATLAASFAALPIVIKLFLKTFYALPFAFHFWNGLRHLVWDTGSMFTIKQVIVSGWTVVGLTVASTLGLLLM